MTRGGGGGDQLARPRRELRSGQGLRHRGVGGRGWLLTAVPSAFTSKIVAEKFHAVLALLPVLKGKVV